MNDAAPISAATAVPAYVPGPARREGGKIGVLLVNLGTPEAPMRHRCAAISRNFFPIRG